MKELGAQRVRKCAQRHTAIEWGNGAWTSEPQARPLRGSSPEWGGALGSTLFQLWFVI